MSRWLIGVVAAVLAGAPLIGCGDDPADMTSESRRATPTAASLHGRAYGSTTVAGRTLATDSELALIFDGGDLRASAGCNTMRAAFEVSDGRLALRSPLTSTLMGCDSDLMAQEQWFTEFLEAGPIIVADGDRLSLSEGSVIIEMVDKTVTDPARPLVGTTWRFSSIIDGETFGSGPVEVERPTLHIAEDGQATVFTGCNRGGAAVEADGSTLTFGPMRLTKMACDPEAMAMEQDVTAILVDETTFEIDGSTLTIMKGDRGLQYRAD